MPIGHDRVVALLHFDTVANPSRNRVVRSLPIVQPVVFTTEAQILDQVGLGSEARLLDQTLERLVQIAHCWTVSRDNSFFALSRLTLGSFQIGHDVS